MAPAVPNAVPNAVPDAEAILAPGAVNDAAVTTIEPPPDYTGPAFQLLPPPSAAAAARDAGSHYDRQHIRTAASGQPIARLLRPLGTGQPPAAIGANVSVASDGVTVVASADGRVCLARETLAVETDLRIKGSVDFATGNIDFPGDVFVSGNVVDKFRVACRGSLHVHGTIEAADVEVARDVRVDGGIVAHGGGRVAAGGRIEAKFVEGGHVQAGGDVVVHREAKDTTVACGGKFELGRGAVYGGRVTANGGVHVANLGSPSGAKTIVEVGVDDGLRQEALAALADLEARRRKIQHARDALAPLMPRAKMLPASQKEKLVGLLYEADEMERDLEARIAPLRQRNEQSAAKAVAAVIVTGTLHPGVTIRAGGLETVITTPVRGPISVACRTIGNVRQLAIVGPGAGRVQPLKTVAAADAGSVALAKLLAGGGK